MIKYSLIYKVDNKPVLINIEAENEKQAALFVNEKMEKAFGKGVSLYSIKEVKSNGRRGKKQR